MPAGVKKHNTTSMALKQFSYEGSPVYYRVEGKGNTVFLVHGFGEKGTVWEEQIAALKDEFRLIIPDLPGTGNSGKVDDMSMEGLAAVLRALAEEEAPGDKIVVIGHSMGGYITLAFAEAYPQLLSGFGLFHSSALPDSEEKKATRRKAIGFIREHGSAAFFRQSTPNLFAPATREEKPVLIDEFIDELGNFSPEILVSYYEAMMERPDRTDVLKNAACPVLFILGQHDTAVPFEDGLKQVNLPKKSYIHVLRQSGHMGMLEEPEKSNHILKDFLRAT